MPAPLAMTHQEPAVTTAAFAPIAPFFGPLRRPLPFPPHRVPTPSQRPLGWPAWLPTPSGRPDLRALGPAAEPAGSQPASAETVLPTTGGWHDSSIDLMLGLEVRDLGPVEWLDEWDGAFLPN